MPPAPPPPPPFGGVLFNEFFPNGAPPLKWCWFGGINRFTKTPVPEKTKWGSPQSEPWPLNFLANKKRPAVFFFVLGFSVLGGLFPPGVFSRLFFFSNRPKTASQKPGVFLTQISTHKKNLGKNNEKFFAHPFGGNGCFSGPRSLGQKSRINTQKQRVGGGGVRKKLSVFKNLQPGSNGPHWPPPRKVPPPPPFLGKRPPPQKLI